MRDRAGELGGFGERSRAFSATGDSLTIKIGPSPEFGPAYTIGKGGRKDKGVRGIDNAQLGLIHHRGIGKARKRPWLGFTSEELKRLARSLEAESKILVRRASVTVTP